MCLVSRIMSALYWLVFLFSVGYSSVGATDCGDGWVAYEGSCYLFGHTLLTFSEAVDFCANHSSARLIHVEEEMENNFIKQFLQDFKMVDYWLGMTDSQSEGDWKWYGDDTGVEFYDWGPGEPQDAQHHEDCAVFGDTIGYRWADVDCETQRKPVCELLSTLSIIG